MTEETAGSLDMSKNCKNEKFYRSTVLKDYTPNSGAFKDFSYGANSITGWRLNQEDRYVCLPFPHFARTWSFFGVYDGHGGEEVAEYLERKLHDHILEQLREYGDIKIALDEGFKECDKGIRTLTEDQFNAIRDSVVKVFSESDYKPSTSDSASASKISENLLSEVKYEFFKRIMELQTDLNKVPFPLSTVEKSDNCEAKESKKDETKAVACSTRSKKPKVQNAGVSPVLEEKKTADEGIPLVGTACGSTATVVVFTDAIIYAANIGDSRCIASVNGQVKSLSHDHRPLNKKEQKRILGSGHKISRGRIDGGLNMSRAFGDFGLKDVKNLKPMLQAVIVEPTICAIEINDDLDFIVVASDGIWNNMENVDVLEFVSENIHLPIPEICAKIFEYILEKSALRQGQDNMSMIIIKNDLKYKNAAKIETGKVETKTAETEKMETEETETEKMDTEETETEKMETEKTETKKTEIKAETRKIKRLKK